MFLLLACTSLSSSTLDPEAVGLDTGLPDARPGDPDDALVEYITLPDMWCGLVTTMTVVVTNVGSTTWTEADGIRLGAVDDDDPLASATRIRLPDYAEIAPGDTWVFNIVVEGPEQAGAYTSDWRMVREGVHWFGDPDEKTVDVSCEDDPEDDPPDDPPDDALDLDEVVWLHGDISDWPETATLSSVSVSGGQICMDYDKADAWPVSEPLGDGTELVGNPWVFIHQDGTWYAATWEWLRPGQTCKNSSSVAGDHIKTSPFDAESGWRPSSGETLYFMVSSLARLGTSSVDERSNVVEVTWP